MRGLVIAGTAVLVLSLMAAPVFGADATTEPGQLFVFVAHQSAPPDADACCQVQLNGQIALGLPHYVLKLDATFAVNASPCTPTLVTISSPIVNGVFMTPPPALGDGISSAIGVCLGPFCPTITGTYWLDLDAAERANPRMFVGKPLNITLFGFWFGVSCGVFDSLTMSAVMVK